MPSTSLSQQRMFGIAHAIQTGQMPASHASGKARQLAKRMSPSDVTDFAATKHKGLPDKKAAGGNRFLAMVRKIQQGHAPLATANDAVANAAKRLMPQDASASPAPAIKASFFSLFNAASMLSKMASVESALAKAERAVQTAGASRRKAVAKQVQELHRHNAQLVKEREAMAQKALKAQGESNEMVSMMNQVPPEMPPAQPPYGQMLMQQSMMAQQGQGGSGGGAAPAMPTMGGTGGKPGII